MGGRLPLIAVLRGRPASVGGSEGTVQRLTARGAHRPIAASMIAAVASAGALVWALLFVTGKPRTLPPGLGPWVRIVTADAFSTKNNICNLNYWFKLLIE